MPPTAHVFTPAEAEGFRRLVDELKQTLRNVRNWSVDVGTNQAPEVYVARVGPGGIPALDENTTSGTGTGSVALRDDVPGAADDCTVYRVVDNGSPTPAPTVLEAFEMGARVYNFSTTAVAGNAWVALLRDKFGFWLAMPFDATAAGGEDDTQIGDVQTVSQGEFDPDPTVNNNSGVVNTIQIAGEGYGGAELIDIAYLGVAAPNVAQIVFRHTPYRPANSADWDGDPETLKDAVDRLAAAVAGLLGVPIP